MFFHEFAQQTRYHPFVSFAAVIGGQIDLTGHFAHGVDQDQRLFVFGADNDIGLYTVFVQPFDLRIDRCSPYPARYEQDIFGTQKVEVGVDQFGGGGPSGPAKSAMESPSFRAHNLPVE